MQDRLAEIVQNTGDAYGLDYVRDTLAQVGIVVRAGLQPLADAVRTDLTT